MNNRLLLNPRLPSSDREIFESAWRKLVDDRWCGQVGIATSGSSGDARGRLIVLSGAALEASAAAVNERLESDAGDVWFKILPDFHVGGLGIRVRAELSGARVVESFLPAWDARAFWDELARSRATLLSLVPTQVFDLVSLALEAPRTLRSVIVGGGRLEAGLHRRAVELGWPVLTSYGLTECCSQVATARSPQDPRLWPLEHVELRNGEHGHIELRSAALLTAQIIFDLPGGAARLAVHPPGEWFRTEDCGQLEADGSLSVFGRSGDFIKIGGEGVVMSRLEDRLERLRRELGSMGDSAVVAAWDERLGAVVILLTTAGEAEAERLRERFNREVQPFERIREVHRLAEIPRSPLGKLLRAQALAASGRPSLINI